MFLLGERGRRRNGKRGKKILVFFFLRLRFFFALKVESSFFFLPSLPSPYQQRLRICCCFSPARLRSPRSGFARSGSRRRRRKTLPFLSFVALVFAPLFPPLKFY